MVKYKEILLDLVEVETIFEVWVWKYKEFSLRYFSSDVVHFKQIFDQ